MHKTEGAHLQRVNNHNAKFEYERNENCWSYRIHKPGHALSIWTGKMSKFNIPKKKLFINVRKIGGAYVQCMKYHYAV